MRFVLSLLCGLFVSYLSWSQTGVGTLRGIVQQSEGPPIPGATVLVLGTTVGTATNEAGQFSFNDLPAQTYTLQISSVGFEEQSKTVNVQAGQITNITITLDEKVLSLDGLVVTAQKRSQLVQEVPIALTSHDGNFLKETNIYEFDALSEYVPGLQVQVQSPNNPGFVIRGITSDDGDSRLEPRVSVFQDGVSISKSRGSVVELFDLERVEVLKGPQGTLFGRGAQIGAVHLIQNKPQRNFNTELRLGVGNYDQRLLSGFVNLPVIEDTLLVRVAGILNQRDGYIQNLSGGNLNGKDTKAIRTSIRYLPGSRTVIDLIVNYQIDTPPGTAFKSGIYAPAGGTTSPFTFADLERGEDLFVDRTVWGTTLLANHTLTNTLDLTSITAYREFDAYESLDADGTVAPALWSSEHALGKQFSQEIRVNYQKASGFSGFGGVSFFWEDGSQQLVLETNEQSLYTLFTPAIRGSIQNSDRPDKESLLQSIPEEPLVNPDGTANLVQAIPDVPEVFNVLAGLPLNASNPEGQTNYGKNYAFELFADGTYPLNDQLDVTLGLRGTYENITGAIESQDAKKFGALGFVLGTLPNNLFPPSRGRVSHNETFLSMVGRVALDYQIKPDWNLFGSVARGRRPNVIQVLGQEVSVLNDEIVWSYELGSKLLMQQDRFQWDASAFYYDYRDFQTQVASLSSAGLVYETRDVGNATAYGFETSLRGVLTRAIQVFGSYAFIDAAFDNNGADGQDQALAGNTFRLTPKHSGSLGLNLTFALSDWGRWFFRPTYSYKSHVFFEEENQAGLEQEGYELLNVRTGVQWWNQRAELAVYVNNATDEDYLIDAGNTGEALGIPTFIAGPPRLFGVQLTGRFR
uniref:TonB-dependent receptor n=1 Tax=Roseihalotalea indica TaxID=2867963 RepID=A0AA49GLE4_9BACT|nr:TonB-dependent receptor [Tunicatimonas sp. TK19036]